VPSIIKEEGVVGTDTQDDQENRHMKQAEKWYVQKDLVENQSHRYTQTDVEH
jgi:hypothetical protein